MKEFGSLSRTLGRIIFPPLTEEAMAERRRREVVKKERRLAGELLDLTVDYSDAEEHRNEYFKNQVVEDLRDLRKKARSGQLNLGHIAKLAVGDTGDLFSGRLARITDQEAETGLNLLLASLAWETAYPKKSSDPVFARFQDYASRQQLDYLNILIVNNILRGPGAGGL